jgi:hypothetical protein
VIDHGKIIAQGSPLELKRQTASDTLEEAFLALTGSSIREENATGLGRMRNVAKIAGHWRTMVRHLEGRLPQCGLAPGAINIIGCGLAHSFKAVRSLEMRVGALPLSASNQMKYYLSWSTARLINEYCQGLGLRVWANSIYIPLSFIKKTAR